MLRAPLGAAVKPTMGSAPTPPGRERDRRCENSTTAAETGISPTSEEPAVTLEAVLQFRHARGRAAALWLRRQDHDDREAVLAALTAAHAAQPNFSLMREGMKFCRDAAAFTRADPDRETVPLAAGLATALLRRFVTPSGAFVEYERNTWLGADTMWRTIPWGTAFSGNRAFEAWMELKDRLTPGQRTFWQASLENTGRWIHRNPVVGGYVFNAGIDLCRLLWRIGREFGRNDWCEWALSAASHRLERDVDDEGWIQAENGGASGHYQLFGSGLLARFAWEAKAPKLEQAVRRIFTRCLLPFATPTLDWPGNFGTRVSKLDTLPGPVVLLAAALGDHEAAWCVQHHGRVDWEGDPALWQAALGTPADEAPRRPAIKEFRGISATVVREGPWMAWFANYDRSIWARGFIDLWHAGHRDWVFSTLHSCGKLSASEIAKTRLGNLSDWAGFPHVRVSAGGRQFDSQQHLESFSATTAADGVRVGWSEPLLDAAGHPGGKLDSSLWFHGDKIEFRLGLRERAGDATLDFHFMRRPAGFVRLWSGDEVADILAGRFLRTEGGYDPLEFAPGETPAVAVQVDRTVFAFLVQSLPPTAWLSLVGETPAGLHTDNLGGFRCRITLPHAIGDCSVSLQLQSVGA